MADNPTFKNQWRAEWGRCPATGKRNYPKRDTARKDAHRAGHLHPYKCEHCGNYHTTSQDRKITKLYKLLKDSK